jgi:hypothetical protein
MKALVLAVSLALSSLTGCALLKQGLEEAKNGIEPNRTAIPEGQGWFCSISSDLTWHSCARTADPCKENLAHNRKQAMLDGRFDLKFKECVSALSATCFTDEEMEMQSNGSAKWAPRSECMPDQICCEALADSYKRRSGTYMRVSKCVAVN